MENFLLNISKEFVADIEKIEPVFVRSNNNIYKAYGKNNKYIIKLSDQKKHCSIEQFERMLDFHFYLYENNAPVKEKKMMKNLKYICKEY